jgi:hypothetical protein
MKRGDFSREVASFHSSLSPTASSRLVGLLPRLEQVVEVLLVLDEEAVKAVEGVLHQLREALRGDEGLHHAQVEIPYLVGQHTVDAVGDFLLVGPLDALVSLVHTLLAQAVGGADTLEDDGQQRRFDGGFHRIALLFGLELGIEHHPQGKQTGRQRDADEEHNPGVLVHCGPPSGSLCPANDEI